MKIISTILGLAFFMAGTLPFIGLGWLFTVNRRNRTVARNPFAARIVYNRLLNGWYVVVGRHQTPISGRFESRAAALESLKSKRA